MIQLNPNWRKVLSREEVAQWADSRPKASFYDLWEDTIDPTWPCLAKAGGATQQQLVFAVCAVARLCLPLIPEGDERPRIAIETAEAWCRGEVTAEQVRESQALAASCATSYIREAGIFAASSTAHFTNLSVMYSSFTDDAAIVAYNAMRAGIESQIVCATLRKHLVFERPPRPKDLTVWQRLAEGGDDE